MSDPQIISVAETDNLDREDLLQILTQSARWMADNVPTIYRAAAVTVPEIADWVRELVTAAVEDMGKGYPVVREGRSLLILGGIGTGKTHQVYGAMRALSVAGVVCRWRVVTAADMFAALRPRHGVDGEEYFEQLTGCSVLAIDDLGAYKGSEWTEEVLFRLIDQRYRHGKPMVVTSNLLPEQFTGVLGARVTSRLGEMCTQIPMTGPDRRRQPNS